MARLRILLASGEELTEFDDGVEEIDDVKKRIDSANEGRPGWVIFGDTLLFSQAASAFQVT